MPASIVFFTGLSFHVLTALLAHITSYNMQWAATKKDLEMPTIQQELPVVLRRHWLTFLVSGLAIVGVALMATELVPLGWRIQELTIMFPVLWLSCGQ